MSDEPSNAASDYLSAVLAYFGESGAPPEELVRAGLADDFSFRDRRAGPSLPDGDAESYPKMIRSFWETGSGRPRWEHQVVAVRGSRFAAVALRVDYGHELLTEGIQLVALDPTLRHVQSITNFNVDDLEGAIAELDRLHGHHPDAS